MSRLKPRPTNNLPDENPHTENLRTKNLGPGNPSPRNLRTEKLAQGISPLKIFPAKKIRQNASLERCLAQGSILFCHGDVSGVALFRFDGLNIASEKKHTG